MFYHLIAERTSDWQIIMQRVWCYSNNVYMCVCIYIYIYIYIYISVCVFILLIVSLKLICIVAFCVVNFTSNMHWSLLPYRLQLVSILQGKYEV